MTHEGGLICWSTAKVVCSCLQSKFVGGRPFRLIGREATKGKIAAYAARISASQVPDTFCLFRLNTTAHVNRFKITSYLKIAPSNCLRVCIFFALHRGSE